MNSEIVGRSSISSKEGTAAKSSSSSTGNPTSICLTAFAFLWAVSILFQYQSQLSWYVALSEAPLGANSLIQGVLLLLAGFVVMRPQNICALLLLAVTQVTHIALNMPDIPNHRLFVAAINLLLLVAAAVAKVQGPLTQARIWELFAPAAQLSLALLYFFAVLAKLNTDFLDVDVSCVSTFYRETRLWYPLLPSGRVVEEILSVGSLLIEYAIPVLLLFGGRRALIGLCLGLSFHYILALNITRHFFDFSSVIFASYAVFLSEAFWRKASNLFSIKRIASALSGRQLHQAFAAAFLLAYFTAVSIGFTALLDIKAFQFRLGIIATLWQVLGSVAIIVCLRILLRSGNAAEAASLIQPWRSHNIHGVLWIVPLVVILNGMAPYLGLKTKSSWDMYSNLRIENVQPNHYLIPNSLDLFKWMGTPVEILTSSKESIASTYVDSGWLLTEFELRRLLQENPSETFTLAVDGKTLTAPSTEASALYPPLPWILRKLLWFRPVDSAYKSRCQR